METTPNLELPIWEPGVDGLTPEQLNDAFTKIDAASLGGGGGGVTYYHHEQGVASDLWVVNHNLGYRPAGWLVYDTSGTQHRMLIEHIDDNTTHLISESGSFGGDAYAS